MRPSRNRQDDPPGHVLLVGSMGAGKTTIGREIAARLGRAFLDSDSALEAECGMTGAEIAASRGVRHLHATELEILLDMIESPSPAVIAAAASVVDSEEGREILAENLTVWLDAPEKVLANRRNPGDDHRREVDVDARNELQRRRRPLWQDVATLRIDSSLPVSDVIDLMLSEIRGLGAH